MLKRDDAPLEPTHARAILLVVPLLLFAAYGLAFWRAAAGARELEFLRDLPRADAASATSHPAIYTGKLRGPEGRVSPAGTPAAAYWWRVERRSDDSTTILCSGRERSRLALETPTGSMRIAFMDADPKEVGLTTDEQDHELGRSIAIDLGDRTGSTRDWLPPGTCEGKDATFEELTLPDGAAVEVVGCAKDGEIKRCDTPLSGAVSSPDLKAYRRHRLDDAVTVFLFPLGFAALILILVGIVLVIPLADMARALGRGKGV